MEENQGENGGKGTRKFWNSGEIAAAALSFLQVCEDPIVGVNQSGGRFNARLVEAFLERCPENYEGGTWKDRTPQTIYEINCSDEGGVCSLQRCHPQSGGNKTVGC